MKPKIQIASSLAVVAAALCAGVVPAAATSSTLLSGYGGPGAGEQAVIGSTLLNAPRGGLRGGGSGSTSAGAVGARASSGSPGSGLGSAAPTGRAYRSPGHLSGSSNGGAGNTERVGGSAERNRSALEEQPGAGGLHPASARSPSGSPVLGLSVADLVAVLAIVAALVALGGLTVRIGRLQR
jgi:hypothetical protein